MGELGAKLMGGVALILLAIFLASLFIILGIVLAMLMSGLISVYMVKTGTKGLVVEQDAGVAMLYSMGWAAMFTAGCVLGSFALLLLLSEWYGPTYAGDLLQYVGGQERLRTLGFLEVFSLLFYGWLLSSACLFFAKSTLAIYLANRTGQALKTQNHSAWLVVLPPAAAILIWFGLDHWQSIANLLSGRTAITELLQQFYETALLPVKLTLLALERPHAVVEWGENYLRDSDGSLFKIAELDSSVFCILALAGALDAVTSQA